MFVGVALPVLVIIRSEYKSISERLLKETAPPYRLLCFLVSFSKFLSNSILISLGFLIRLGSGFLIFPIGSFLFRVQRYNNKRNNQTFRKINLLNLFSPNENMAKIICLLCHMPTHLESKLQQACIKWFDLQYPQYRLNMFAVPNGGRRGKVEAGIMKGEGVRSGVADLFFAFANYSKHGLFIEMKFGKGKQSDTQKAFQIAVEKEEYQYAVVSDFDSFKKLIDDYLK